MFQAVLDNPITLIKFVYKCQYRVTKWTLQGMYIKEPLTKFAARVIIKSNNQQPFFSVICFLPFFLSYSNPYLEPSLTLF